MRTTLPLSALAWIAACASHPAPAESAAVASADVASPAWLFLRASYDADGDGVIQPREYTRSEEAFHRLDADGDGAIGAADFAAQWDGVPRIRSAADDAAHGGWITMDDFVHGEGGPEVGEPAPLFKLVATSGEQVELASFRHKKPVVLVFGSYT